jgi:predicted nucleic acid-binding protein
MLIVLDTNVLVSGLLNPFGPPGRILDLMVAGLVRLAYDGRILAEYREAASRPRFRLGPDLVGPMLDYVVRNGEMVSAPPLMVEAPHPSDLAFAEVAVASAARGLVTGNLAHFLFLADPPVLNPADCLLLWERENR